MYTFTLYHFRTVLKEYLSSDGIELDTLANQDLLKYLQCVGQRRLPSYIFVCESLHKVVNVVDEGYFEVVLTGLKGIGKSVTTTVLFLLCNQLHLTFI